MKDKKDIALANFKGFIRKGARSNISGNIPTGHFELDFLIHNGSLPSDVDLTSIEGYDPGKTLGIPLGKLVELFGEEGSGKSSLAYRLVGYAQKMGYTCAWIDTEQSFADGLAVINGVDQDELLYSDMSNPDDPEQMFFAEHVFDNIIELCKSGVKVIVLDSVANLIPKDQMETSAEQLFIARLARLMSSNLGKLVNYAAKFGVLLLFINQIREKPGVMFGNPETTPGGRALKFNASLRIRIQKKHGKDAEITVPDDNGKEPRVIGGKALVRIEKNRFAKPYRNSILVPIYYEAYFPDIEEIAFNFGRQLKLITVRKGVYAWKDGKFEGREKFIEYLKYNSLIKTLIQELAEEAKKQNVIMPPELTQTIEGMDEKKASDDDDDKAKKRVSRPRKGKVSEGGDDNVESPGGEDSP